MKYLIFILIFIFSSCTILEEKQEETPLYEIPSWDHFASTLEVESPLIPHPFFQEVLNLKGDDYVIAYANYMGGSEDEVTKKFKEWKKQESNIIALGVFEKRKKEVHLLERKYLKDYRKTHGNDWVKKFNIDKDKLFPSQVFTKRFKYLLDLKVDNL